MNGNPKNRNVAPPKQINRIAAPIQVTPTNNGQVNQVNNVQNVQQVQTNQVNMGAVNPTIVAVNTNPQQVQNQIATPTSALAQAAQNQSVRGANAVKKKNILKEHDPSTMIFVTILLIILACLCAFIYYVILPRIEASKNQIEFNDATTVPVTASPKIPAIQTSSINNGNIVTDTGTYPIDTVFTLTTTNTGANIDISINGTKVTSTKKLLSTIGRVDDLIVLILADGNIRSNRVVIFDKNASLIKEINHIENADGMLLLEEMSGYIFSSNNLILVTSRIKNNQIILSSELGSTEGIDICNVEELHNNNINDDFMVMGNYSLSYNGNNSFSDPIRINSVTLQEYRDSNKLCR